jgi:hypothetical protein
MVYISDACISEGAAVKRRVVLQGGVLILICCVLPLATIAQQPGRAIIPHLQDRFGLSDGQVRGALGALLVFAREQLPKTQFDDLAARIPNADRIMQEVKMRGIVTKPLDDLDEYEEALAQLGMGQPLASQFAPAVVEYLGAAGFAQERDILAQLVY